MIAWLKHLFAPLPPPPTRIVPADAGAKERDRLRQEICWLEEELRDMRRVPDGKALVEIADLCDLRACIELDLANARLGAQAMDWRIKMTLDAFDDMFPMAAPKKETP